AVEIPWRIEKCGIKNPEQKGIIEYSPNKVQYPQWDYEPSFVEITFTEETSGTDVGVYDVVCECDNNCYFTSTGTNICESDWEIQKHLLKPPQAEKEYAYTGEVITPKFFNYKEEYIRVSGELSAVEPGEYVAYFEIKDKKNYDWKYYVHTKDGKVAAAWKIVFTNYVDIPRQNNAPRYDGTSKSPTWFNYIEKAMTLLGGTPSEINAGTYYVTFSLKKGYRWADGTREGSAEDRRVSWNIYKKRVPRPYIKGTENEGTGAYYYELEGKRYPIWAYYDSEVMVMSGDTYDVDGSWHTTYFDLKDPENYEWDNGISDTHSVRWKLTKPYAPEVATGKEKLVHIPRQVDPPIEDGTTKYPKWDSFNNTAIVKIGGDWEGVYSGEYKVVLSLRDGYMWEDGTKEVKIVPWVILSEKQQGGTSSLVPIRIPHQIDPPTFDGTVKEPQWDSWDKYGFDIVVGVLYGVLAGTYRLTLRLQTGYIWEDGSTDEKVVTWIINKREIIELPDEPIPKDPEPEKEGNEGVVEQNRGSCCCCCDSGLFDKLNEQNFDYGTDCGCSK
ncbi:MAG: hypothetical protein HDT44_01185, partial [Ruminococcaceae bacterium]|nr:hypothetical protein [Oscillospiraceae bacterium]